MVARSDSFMSPPGSPVNRFLWQSGGLAVGRAAALLALVLIARDLGTAQYGRFVVVLALLELCNAPWKPTVWQGAAASLARGAGHSAWRARLAAWWLAGAMVVGPIVWVVAGAVTTACFVAVALTSAVMAEHIPAHLLAGRQRRIAVATVSAQVTRLVVVAAAIFAGVLTIAIAIALIGVGRLVGIVLLRSAPTPPGGAMGALMPETSTEAITWIEVHGPILVVAWLLGLDAAGGFDLLYKLSAALVELIAGIGLVLIPNLVGDSPVKGIVASGIRLPTLGAVLLAVAFALAAAPGLELAVGGDLGLGLAPAMLGLTMALAPWMGTSKATLLTREGARWVLQSQISMAAATLAASMAATVGIVWAATAIAAGHFVGATVRWVGMRSIDAVPSAREVFAVRKVADDFRRISSLLRGA